MSLSSPLITHQVSQSVTCQCQSSVQHASMLFLLSPRLQDLFQMLHSQLCASVLAIGTVQMTNDLPII